jgi:hypothetical protein
MNKKNILIQCVILLVAIFATNNVLAQELPVGTPIEDFYRRKQLLGQLDSNISFTVRPLSAAAIGKTDNIFDPDHSISQSGHINSIYNFAGGKGVFQILPISWKQQYNTHNPYGWNDGAMIPAAGYQSLFSMGFYAKYKFISIQLQPEFVYAQNKFFDGFNEAGNDEKAWKAWYKLYNYVDLPERFGTTPYSKLLPGQSSIRINFDPVSFGLSTENLWWGPGIQNSLIMSNTATGFAHLTLNTTRPVNTPVGSFESQLIAGKLLQSGYTPQVPGQPGNYDKLTIPKPNDWRYLSGIVFTYHPKWTPGLFLGVTRVFQVYKKNLGSGLKNYIPLFSSLDKASFFDPATGINTEDNALRDQLSSIFVRWALPAAQAEVYFEYGKEDHTWDTRDLFLEASHSRAYIIGFKKLVKIGHQSDEYLQFNIEETQLGYPANQILNRNTTPDWYASYQVPAGYTNRGEVLGAGIGPGSNLQSFDIAWTKGIRKIELQVKRYEHSTDFYYQAFAVGEVGRHWTDFSFGLNTDWNYKNFILSTQVTYMRQLNYQWKFKNDPKVFYFDQKRFDANNFQLGLGLIYRL